MPGGSLPLDRWANFYLVVSAAAATLIGLLFVVITVAAERMDRNSIGKIRLYLTPTVVFFGSVLGLATLLTFPVQTPASAALCIGLVALLGLIYSGSLPIRRGGEKQTYTSASEVLEYVGLPLAAYGVLLVGAGLAWAENARALTLVAVGMVALLALAIRNSWAVAITVVTGTSNRAGR